MYPDCLQDALRFEQNIIMLISALTFASLLIAQQTSVFVGLMRWTTALFKIRKSPYGSWTA